MLKAAGNTSAEFGPPDSHEAMNNRELTGNLRQKRSYEFLIGLVHNNSKYEVTRVDSAPTTMNPAVALGNSTAGEVLLELMVKIASHPDEWNKVHKLLKNIDDSLTTSKKIVDSLEQSSAQANKETNKIEANKDDKYKEDKRQNARDNRSDRLRQDNLYTSDADYDVNLGNRTLNSYKSNSWPEFRQQKFGTLKNTYRDMQNPNNAFYGNSRQFGAASRNSYRNFAYRVVTDVPSPHHGSPPKAYIAVSLIAPKPMDSPEDDIVLENELRQLKPWPHLQDVQDMPPYHMRRIKSDEN